MNVLLTALNSKYIHNNIGLRYLEIFSRNQGFSCEIEEFTINEEMTKILDKIMVKSPDVVAFSVYIWNFELVKKLSVLLKQINEDIIIVYGGPEVSFDCVEHLETMAGDYIIYGEGENSFKELMTALYKGSSIDEVKGICFKKEGMAYLNGPREKIDLKDLPYPYEEDELLEGKLAYIETSRGCPYQCSYCLSSSEIDLRFVSFERVKTFIDRLLLTRSKIIKFIDRTFNIHSDAMEIWSYIISLDTQVTFHFEISPDLIKEEHIELLLTAPKGRIQFEVGVQSTKKEVLKIINRHMGFEKVSKKLLLLKKLENIHTHMDLIAGLPLDSFETFHASFNDLYAIKPDMLQLGFLKIIKGTPMARDAKKYGMVYSPYAPYEILKTNWISFSDLRRLHDIEEMVETYYNSGRFHTTLSYLIGENTDALNFYERLAHHIKEEFSDNAVSFKDYFRMLKEFGLEELKRQNRADDPIVLNELLKYDWLGTHKKQYVPDFLHRNTKKRDDLRREAMEKTKQKIHLEIFNIDLIEYLQNGQIILGESPVFYGEDGKIMEIELKNC
ncbi:MAG: DUF4080 domain-containing protein [Clostridium sp.]|nr:DUF4080 domain-containing protein [Clostridium sp.]